MKKIRFATFKKNAKKMQKLVDINSFTRTVKILYKHNIFSRIPYFCKIKNYIRFDENLKVTLHIN